MRMFLCGGGSGKKIKEATIKFGSLIDKSKPLLYIPLAMKSEKYDSCLEWIKEEMNIIGINNIDMVTSGEDLYKKNFDNYSAIYIGGGNTYKLLRDIKENNCFDKIKRYIDNDGVVFGGSAGAIIFGKDIDTCKYEDDNSIIALKDTSSFDVLSGYSLLCHYNDNIVKTENNINYLKKYSIGRKVIYLPEEDTIFIDSNDIELIGDKEYIVFNNGNMQVITVTENNR